MKISTIVDRTNEIIGHGSYSYNEMLFSMDECVDQINEDLGITLPLISEIYANSFVTNEYEDAAILAGDYTFADNEVENQYTRIPDPYLRNYVCYEVAYKILTREDEPEEVTLPKLAHARDWYKKLIAVFSSFMLEDTEAISLN